MGQVVDNRRFWNRVPRTQTVEAPVVISRPSLDTLTDAVENARNRMVHCQCELAKAENAYAEAQRAWADAIIERGVELAIPEFCQLRIAHPRRREEDRE
jgi:hypothetical protein